MAKTRKQKEVIIDSLNQKVQNMKAAVIVDYKGMKVKDITVLRKNLRAQNVDFNVAKTTLLRIAFKNHNIEIDESLLKQPVAVAFAMGDEVAPAKEIDKFAKTNEAIQVLGGILEGKQIDAAAVKRLAALPSREQLYGQLVGTIAAPISGFVNVLAGNLRGLVNVLNAYKDQKEA
ncbi:MAG: 50S ribosomal protein L10 [bacterium]